MRERERERHAPHVHAPRARAAPVIDLAVSLSGLDGEKSPQEGLQEKATSLCFTEGSQPGGARND